MNAVDAHGKDVIPPIVKFEKAKLHTSWRIRFADDQITASGTHPAVPGAIRAIIAFVVVADAIRLYQLLLRDGELERADRRTVVRGVALMFNDRNMQ